MYFRPYLMAKFFKTLTCSSFYSVRLQYSQLKKQKKASSFLNWHYWNFDPQESEIQWFSLNPIGDFHWFKFRERCTCIPGEILVWPCGSNWVWWPQFRVFVAYKKMETNLPELVACLPDSRQIRFKISLKVKCKITTPIYRMVGRRFAGGGDVVKRSLIKLPADSLNRLYRHCVSGVICFLCCTAYRLVKSLRVSRFRALQESCTGI